MHPDFGSFQGYGIPINVVAGSQKKKHVTFDWYGTESDHVGYPIPKQPKIERGSDAHMLIVDRGHCRLYELYHAHKTASGWHAGSGATWNLRSEPPAPGRDGRAPMPPACRSCPAWCAGTRSRRA